MKSDHQNPEASRLTERQNKPRPKFTLYRLLALVVLICLAFVAIQRRMANTPTKEPTITTETSLKSAPDNDHRPFNPQRRYDLTYDKVAAWPSTGGVWIKKASAVELQALGIDRFNNTERASDLASEDKFCDRLRTFGASFYSLPPQWPEGVVWCEDMDDCVEPKIRVAMEVGFPKGGGAWVLDMTQGAGQYGAQLQGLRNALDMEERCQVIKSLGGKFCADIKTCIEEAPK